MFGNGENTRHLPSAPYRFVSERLHQLDRNPYYQSTADSSVAADGNVAVASSATETFEKFCREKKSVIILAFVSVVFLTLAASLITVYAMAAYGKLEKYGQKCTPGDPTSCNRLELVCLNSGICGCKSSNYKWDQQQGLCVALVNTKAACRKWGWDGSYAVPCTENAVCNADNHCECLPYFVEIGQECIASYDAVCSSSRDCNQQEFLFCGTSGKCECRPGTVRHRKANVFGCFVKIGETCAGNMRDLCVDPNSECSMEQICRCNKDKGFVPSRANTSCGKIANNTCGTDSDCADTLSCIKIATTDQVGVCFCRDTELLLEQEQKCQIKAGQRCDATNLKQCVENAFCKHSTCACNHGWGLDEASGLCLGTHGTACTTNGNCLGSHYFQCNDGKCSCDQSHTHFSETSGSCFGFVTDTICVSDVNCDERRMVCDPETKLCSCSLGFEEDNKSCYGTYGTGCAETSDCFRPEHLSCLEGSCGCNSASEDWDTKQCAIQFRQRCGEPGNRINMKCVGNLTCLVDATHTNDVFKLCGCDAKHVLSEDRRLCINNASSIQGSAFALLIMFITVQVFGNNL